MNNIIDVLRIPNFIIEKTTLIDGTENYIRPLYIELLYLYPELLNNVANDIVKKMETSEPSLLYAIEASILPLAGLIASKLNIPLSVIRKPYNYKHEEEKPLLFLPDYSCMKNIRLENAILIDDAIWSGYTIDNTLSLLEKMNIPVPNLFFLFDFYNYNYGGSRVQDKYKTLIDKRMVWYSYGEILDIAYKNNLISSDTYKKSKSLMKK